MTWEEKLAALKALANTHLEMRAPGDWYVSAYAREVGGNGMLEGRYGNGRTPQEAVEDDWEKMTAKLPADRYIVVYASGEDRQQYRWNGYMWITVR